MLKHLDTELPSLVHARLPLYVQRDLRIHAENGGIRALTQTALAMRPVLHLSWVLLTVSSVRVELVPVHLGIMLTQCNNAAALWLAWELAPRQKNPRLMQLYPPATSISVSEHNFMPLLSSHGHPAGDSRQDLLGRGTCVG